MLEEIILVDVEPEPIPLSTSSKRLSDPMIITTGDSDQQQSIIKKIFKQGKNAFSQKPSYAKLVEDDSESGDPVRQQIGSDGNVLPCKKQHCGCLCYILLTILLIVLIFLSGFGLGQTFRRQPMTPSSVQSKYTSMWTNDSAKFGIINGSISDYYYAAFEISVVVASNYSFSTESNINTYGYIYNNTFHPDNPSLNLLTKDGNGGENGQSKLTAFLQPWTSYILVVTTFAPNATGRFLIIASGPTTVVLRPILMPPLQQTVYSSEWTTHSQVYCRDRCSTPDYQYDFDDDYYYETILMNVSKASNFTIMSQSSINTYGYLYENSFDPSDTSLNLLMEDDNSGSNEQFKLTTFLRPSTIYILVATTFSPHVMGKFSIIASGTSFISLTRVSSHRTTIETAMPWSVQSMYSSAWTTESQSYCRTSCEVSYYYYYYEAIQVRVSTHGTYSLASQSSVDTYGYLYNSSFDSFSPSSNLLLQDDEGGNNGQYKLTCFLEPDFIYILVATTFYPDVTGSFSISASGPGSVTFSTYMVTQTL